MQPGQVGEGQWWHGKLVFPANMQHGAARHQYFEMGAFGQEFRKQRGGRQRLLKVVQQEQEWSALHILFQEIEEGTVSRLLYLKRAGNSGDDQRGIADRSQLDKANSGLKIIEQIAGDLQTQSCFPYPSGTREGHEPRIWPPQQRIQRPSLLFTSNQRRQLRWQPVETNVQHAQDQTSSWLYSKLCRTYYSAMRGA